MIVWPGAKKPGEAPTDLLSLGCAPGSEPTEQRLVCTKCKIGRSKATRADEVCAPCAPGRYSSGEGAKECTACDVHRYQPQGGKADCQNCPARFNTSEGSDRCDFCAADFYNATARQHVCFGNGYNPEAEQEHVERYWRDVNLLGQCDACPVDETGEGCMVCAAGSMGGTPDVAAGFIIPDLREPTRRRLRQLRAEGEGGFVGAGELAPVQVLRCHPDIDLARIRCPGGGRGPSSPQTPLSRLDLRGAHSYTPQVHPGSLNRCGEST